MANYVIKNHHGDVIGWGQASPVDFNAGLPAGLEWVVDPYIDPNALVAFPSLSPRQFRQALTALGLRAAVEAAIAAADQDTKDWYEYATTFERNHSVLIAMATALGKTGADIDALFALGATL